MANLLVIDDDPIVLETVADILKGRGYEVLTAVDGERGLEAARSVSLDLVICDVGLPRMDGFAVLRQFQKDDALNDVPFIFLSGQADTQMVRTGMALGADDFLLKPFSLAELLRVVQVRLEKRARRQAMLLNAIDQLRLNITMALPHELRTAIMVIEGYAYLVLDDSVNIDPVQRQMIEAIKTSAGRLHTMAEKYLWYLIAHTQDGRSIYQAPTALEQVIEQTIFQVAQRMGRENDVLLLLTPHTKHIHPEYFARIIEELVENAFKFSQAGTKVEIFASDCPDGYSISITNTGREFTPEQIQQIGGFMQFERHTYEQQGTGLGLVIAKALTELCGGQLSVQSQHGETTIKLVFPQAADGSTHISPAASQPSVRLARSNAGWNASTFIPRQKP